MVHDYPTTAKDNINWYAPELLEQNLCGYNAKTDIYGIGILCCELANGTVPFEPLSPTELLLDKLTGYIPRLLDKTCEELKSLDLDSEFRLANGSNLVMTGLLLDLILTLFSSLSFSAQKWIPTIEPGFRFTNQDDFRITFIICFWNAA